MEEESCWYDVFQCVALSRLLLLGTYELISVAIHLTSVGLSGPTVCATVD